MAAEVSRVEQLNNELKNITSQLADLEGKISDVSTAQRMLGPSELHRQRYQRANINKRRRIESVEKEINGEFGDADDDGEEIDGKKPSLASSVIPTNKILRTRDDLILLAGGKDEEVCKRNRRIFGLVVNTLREFKKINETNEDPSTRRCREVEDKLKTKAEEEQRRLQDQKRALVQEKRLMIEKQKGITMKIELLTQIQEWEKAEKCLVNFIRTKTQPNIFWRPAKFDSCVLKRLQDSATSVKAGVARRIAHLQADIKKIDNVNNKDNEVSSEKEGMKRISWSRDESESEKNVGVEVNEKNETENKEEFKDPSVENNNGEVTYDDSYFNDFEITEYQSNEAENESK